MIHLSWPGTALHTKTIKLSKFLTHDFLEDNCILNGVGSLSNYSLDIVNEDVKVETRELPDILCPLITLNLYLRWL